MLKINGSTVSQSTLTELSVDNLRRLIISGEGDHEQTIRWCAKLVALRKKQLESWDDPASKELVIF